MKLKSLLSLIIYFVIIVGSFMKAYSNRGLNGMEKRKIADESNKVLGLLNYQSGEVDILELAKELGFQVGIAPLIDEEDGFIIVDDSTSSIQRLTGLKTDKIIGVNSERNIQTKRFIIAHELGHYCLHYKEEVSDGMYAHRENRKGKNENENDADFFAACLLMPEKAFGKKYKELKDKGLLEDEIVILLANHFNVPKESATRRVAEVTEG